MQTHVPQPVAGAFLPHGYCYLWDTPLLVTHVVADLLIGTAYVVIAVGLGMLVHRLRRDIPFSTVFVAFGVFIISCGFTHFVEVWTLWHPVYWFAGAVKGVTAAASVVTAMAMPFTIPRVIGTVRDATQSRARELRAARADALEEQNATLTALAAELAAVNERLRDALGAAEHERQRAETAAVDAALAQSRAEEANRVKSDFMRTMSHELRTPLNAIGGYVELLDLELRGPVTAAQRDDLHRIRHAQGHLLRIITDILTYARIEAGALEYRADEVALPSLLADVAALIRPQMGAKGQELSFMFDQADDLVARADGDKLAQVFLNLLSNAQKYTPVGGRVLITASRSADRLRVIIADSGPGIPADRHEAVFEPFVQAVGGLSRPHDGAGLGLTISRDMLRAMGGDLQLADAPTRRTLAEHGTEGAAFLVELCAA